MEWTDIRLTVAKADAENAEAVATLIAEGGIYIEDYSDIEQQVAEIAHVDLIEQELLDKPRDTVIIHLYLEPGASQVETLALIDLSELDSRLADCRIDVACDVTNPLTGPQGASAVFGPQKGATAQMIDRLDTGLRHYARIIARDLDIDVLSLEGGGAAGGMGAALYAFCGAQLRPGIEIVTDALQLAERVADADLVITGEGRIDSQTIHGKVPVGVARVAKRFNVPVIGIAGSLTADVGVVHQHGLDAVFSVLYTICTLDEALANAAANLRMTARNVAAVLQMGDRR